MKSFAWSLLSVLASASCALAVHPLPSLFASFVPYSRLQHASIIADLNSNPVPLPSPLPLSASMFLLLRLLSKPATRRRCSSDLPTFRLPSTPHFHSLGFLHALLVCADSIYFIHFFVSSSLAVADYHERSTSNAKPNLPCL